MTPVILTPEARADITAILLHSRRAFGSETGRRYRMLIEQALSDLSTDPEHPLAAGRDGLPPDIRLYHLRHSRLRIPRENRISQPRHFIVFRRETAGVAVLRLLHDSMDIAHRLG